MSDNFLFFSVLSFAYCFVVLTLTGFFIYKKKQLNLSRAVALSAGVIVILAVFEFLPHSLSAGAGWRSLIIISIGFLVNAFAEIIILSNTKFLNRLLPAGTHDCHQHDSEHTHFHLVPSSAGCSVVSCLVLCAFFDGTRLAGALLIDIKTAFIMSIGLLFHLLPESLAVAGIGLSSGFSRKFLLILSLIFCLAFLAGYHLFFLLSRVAGGALSFFQPFAAGLFLYVCFVHFFPIVIKFKVKRWFLIGAGLGALFLLFPHLPSHH